MCFDKLSTYKEDMSQCLPQASDATGTNGKLISRRVVAIVTGRMNRNSTPTSPVQPIRNCTNAAKASEP